jgi:hypothetical protein
MPVWVNGKTARLLGVLVVVGVPLGTQAHAKTVSHTSHGTQVHHTGGQTAANSRGHESDTASQGRSLHGGAKHAFYASRHGGKAMLRYASTGRGGGISCVPYAREVSGIDLKGNAATWWDEADGVYARGAAPEAGSVLNFRANASMHLGHVAVVSNVIGRREIEIDHANWWGPGATKGGISHNISVIDVSPNNDWTAVRVGLGHTGEYGSIYPTYGFIYDRRAGTPSHTPLVTAAAEPVPPLNEAPRDLRPRSERFAARKVYNEVAEAPAAPGFDLNMGTLTQDAPDRSVR